MAFIIIGGFFLVVGLLLTIAAANNEGVEFRFAGNTTPLTKNAVLAMGIIGMIIGAAGIAGGIFYVVANGT